MTVIFGTLPQKSLYLQEPGNQGQCRVPVAGISHLLNIYLPHLHLWMFQGYLQLQSHEAPAFIPKTNELLYTDKKKLWGSCGV